MLGGIRSKLCEWKVCLCKGGFGEAKLPILRARKRQGFHVGNKRGWEVILGRFALGRMRSMGSFAVGRSAFL